MSAQDIIEQIKALPMDERAQVTKYVVEFDDYWIPEEFKQGMADIAADRVVDLDTALTAPFTQQLALTGGKVFVDDLHESLGTVRPF